MINAEDIIDNLEIIVPVIGENCFLYQEPSGESIPLQSFVVDKLTADKGVSPELVEKMKSSGYYGLSLLIKYGYSSKKAFRSDYSNLIKRNEGRIHLKETVKRFLDTFKFPVIITTSCFGLIEKKLSTHYDSAIYQPSVRNGKVITDDSRIVYHIFGLLQAGTAAVTDENEMLMFLHDLHGEGASDLKSYINSDRKKALFIIGSNLPDWLFRFFLYPMKGIEKEQDGYFLSTSEKIEDSLVYFLNSLSYEYAEESEIYSVLSEAVALNPSPETDNQEEDRKPHGMKYDIFLSYASENERMVREIKERLEQKFGLKVWFDKKNIPDGDYVDRIIDGINHSAYFMPIVTKEYIEKHHTLNNPPQGLEEIVGNSRIEFVQKETLYAALCREKDKGRKVYSLPIVKEEPVGYGLQLNPGLIEQRYVGDRLPPTLFLHQQMFAYDKMFNGDIDWSRYKEIEL